MFLLEGCNATFSVHGSERWEENYDGDTREEEVREALITIFTGLYDRAVERAIKRIPNCTSNWTHTRAAIA